MAAIVYPCSPRFSLYHVGVGIYFRTASWHPQMGVVAPTPPPHAPMRLRRFAIVGDWLSPMTLFLVSVAPQRAQARQARQISPFTPDKPPPTLISLPMSLRSVS